MVHDLDGALQHGTLITILTAAQAAEDECNQIQEIARGMLISQGFFLHVAAPVGANASQAEKTLSHYNGGDTGKRPKKNCWGCGGDHSCMRKGTVVCPRGTDPAIIKTAAEKYAAYKELMGKRGIRR